MVTYYNKKDLINFTNYVIDELKEKFPELVDYDGTSHADFENWLSELKYNKDGRA